MSSSTGEVGKDLPLKTRVQPEYWDLMMSPPSGLTPASSQSSNCFRKLLGGEAKTLPSAHTLSPDYSESFEM